LRVDVCGRCLRGNQWPRNHLQHDIMRSGDWQTTYPPVRFLGKILLWMHGSATQLAGRGSTVARH
jgi:hypothetical protein